MSTFSWLYRCANFLLAVSYGYLQRATGRHLGHPLTSNHYMPADKLYTHAAVNAAGKKGVSAMYTTNPRGIDLQGSGNLAGTLGQSGLGRDSRQGKSGNWGTGRLNSTASSTGSMPLSKSGRITQAMAEAGCTAQHGVASSGFATSGRITTQRTADPVDPNATRFSIPPKDSHEVMRKLQAKREQQRQTQNLKLTETRRLAESKDRRADANRLAQLKSSSGMSQFLQTSPLRGSHETRESLLQGFTMDSMNTSGGAGAARARMMNSSVDFAAAQMPRNANGTYEYRGPQQTGHMAGYSGFVPHIQHVAGRTFGRGTHRAMTKSAKRLCSSDLVPANPHENNRSYQRLGEASKQQGGQIPGYTGHVTGIHERFGERYAKSTAELQPGPGGIRAKECRKTLHTLGTVETSTCTLPKDGFWH